ncbi:serine/threonine-protein kinase 17A isoform X1 [Talpa occidentalis]|uniref:serine/threonine-protein kinase 17A isoform X1 n=1 Tax=Talpa occidentalis TaxID=50954 RepID=UPI00188E2E93|nr:serine/threonine-protein kinase 17A isoform X1 [Talpa occidentalis]
MIPQETPGGGDFLPTVVAGSGPTRRGPGASRGPPSPQARGLLTAIRAAVRTEPFRDGYSLSPGRELGRGKFAVVRKCIKKDSGKEFAAKFMRKRRKGQDCRMEIIHEIAVLELAEDNPWVINLHEVYETPSEIILVLEYAAGGEVFDQCVADREEGFKEKDVQRLLRQILEGVYFLHTHDVVHLDLKPQNILLTSDSPLGDVKIVDFGLSRIMKNNEELREIMGTPEYVAPEILSYDPISMATDMWSIGVLTYVMLTGISPFLGNNKQETFLNISQMNLSYSEEEFDVVSESAIDFIKRLLVQKPEDRATAEECLKHPWLTQSNIQDPSFKVKVALEETNALQEGDSVSKTNSDTRKTETEESIVTEELIVVTSYTLGQCRQSEKEKMEQKAISKRFKFEEPLLQEIPGEFIY